MKNGRQKMILEIIDSMAIQTQADLAEELRRRGLDVTQATVSRDIHDLKLVKTTNSSGAHVYTVRKPVEETISPRQMRIFADSVTSVEAAQNIIVIKTISGSASAAAETIDAFHWPEIVGSIAGDNTILVVATDIESALDITERFRTFIQE